jgi:raffinose/stachyose/melibiose transport system permease protein
MRQEKARKTLLTIVFIVVCIIYLMPVLTVLMNSFKTNSAINTETFALPNEERLGRGQLRQRRQRRGIPFLKSAGYSLLITITSAALILVCTSWLRGTSPA